MGATAEVRWFYAGDVPEAADAWFRALPGEPTEEARTDRYLRPTDAALNLKVREGQVEIKRRDAEGDRVPFQKDVVGHVERWRKWSFDAAERTSADGTFWVAVAKTRRKLRYRIGPDGQVIAHRDEAPPANGCDLEVTRIAVGDDRWWSVCLEAFGDEADVRDTLLRTARYVFAIGHPPPLDAAHAMGYAAWLLALSGQLSAKELTANG